MGSRIDEEQKCGALPFASPSPRRDCPSRWLQGMSHQPRSSHHLSLSGESLQDYTHEAATIHRLTILAHKMLFAGILWHSCSITACRIIRNISPMSIMAVTMTMPTATHVDDTDDREHGDGDDDADDVDGDGGDDDICCCSCYCCCCCCCCCCP